MQTKEISSSDAVITWPLISEESFKRIFKVIIWSLAGPLLAFIFESIFISEFTFGFFFGILFMEIGLFIIFGSFAALFDPFFQRKKVTTETVKGVKIKHDSKKDRKLPVDQKYAYGTEGLRSKSKESKPMTREERIYWGKLIFISAIFLFGFQSILYLIVLSVFGECSILTIC